MSAGAERRLAPGSPPTSLRSLRVFSGTHEHPAEAQQGREHRFQTFSTISIYLKVILEKTYISLQTNMAVTRARCVYGTLPLLWRLHTAPSLVAPVTGGVRGRARGHIKRLGTSDLGKTKQTLCCNPGMACISTPIHYGQHTYPIFSGNITK